MCGHAVQIFFGKDDIGSHSAVAVDTETACVAAKLRQSHVTGGAMAAGIEMRLGGHTVAHGQASTGALNGFDYADEFMSHDEWRRAGEFAMINMIVHTADSAGLDADADIVESICLGNGTDVYKRQG